MCLKPAPSPGLARLGGFVLKGGSHCRGGGPDLRTRSYSEVLQCLFSPGMFRSQARWVDSTTAAGAAARAIQLLVSTGQSWKTHSRNQTGDCRYTSACSKLNSLMPRDFNSTDFQKTALLKAGDRPEAASPNMALHETCLEVYSRLP